MSISLSFHNIFPVCGSCYSLLISLLGSHTHTNTHTLSLSRSLSLSLSLGERQSVKITLRTYRSVTYIWWIFGDLDWLYCYEVIRSFINKIDLAMKYLHLHGSWYDQDKRLSKRFINERDHRNPRPIIYMHFTHIHK